MGQRPIQVDEKCWTLRPCSQRFVTTPLQSRLPDRWFFNGVVPSYTVTDNSRSKKASTSPRISCAS